MKVNLSKTVWGLCLPPPPFRAPSALYTPAGVRRLQLGAKVTIPAGGLDPPAEEEGEGWIRIDGIRRRSNPAGRRITMLIVIRRPLNYKIKYPRLGSQSPQPRKRKIVARRLRIFAVDEQIRLSLRWRKNETFVSFCRLVTYDCRRVRYQCVSNSP